MFKDRRDAGRQLGARLQPLAGNHPIVLGLARGGVVVATEVAHSLGAPLDVMVARKIGAPFDPEFAIGAIAPGVIHLNPQVVTAVHADPHYIESQAAREREVMTAREQLYRGNRPAPDVANRVVILVDDGLATGMTAAAAILSLRAQKPARIVFAVPVGAPDAVRKIARMADEVVCLFEPHDLRAISLHYRDFGETSDAEVESCLAHGRNMSAALTG